MGKRATSMQEGDVPCINAIPGDHPDLNLSPPDLIEKLSPQKKLKKNGLVGEQGLVPNSWNF